MVKKKTHKTNNPQRKTYTPPKGKIRTIEELLSLEPCASVSISDIQGKEGAELKAFVFNKVKDIPLKHRYLYTQKEIGCLLSHHMATSALKKAALLTVPYVINNGYPITQWGLKPDNKININRKSDKMPSCLFGASIMIDGKKYLCELSLKFNGANKILPWALVLLDEKRKKGD